MYMNIERAQQLAEVLENPIPHLGFNMQWFTSRNGYQTTTPIEEILELLTTGCGTACCIGGLACLIFADREQRQTGASAYLAMNLLDLSHEEAVKLFYNYRSYVSPAPALKEITREEAAVAVRKMIASNLR